MRKALEVGIEPSGRTYHDLLYRALPWTAELLLVVVPLPGGGDPLLPAGRKLLEDLAPYCTKESDERDWPGTQLEGDARGRVYRYRVVPDVLDIVAEATDHLYGWCPPDLPQDIALVHGDGEPFLASVTQERWAALTIDDEESAALSDLDLGLRDLWA